MNNLLSNTKNSVNYLIIGAISIFIVFVCTFIKVEASLWSILCLSIISFIYSFLRKRISDKKEFKIIFKICILGFALRFIMIAAASVFPSLSIPSDATTYEATALGFIKDFSLGKLPQGVFSDHFFYYLCNSIVFYIFGYLPSVLKIVNAFLGVMAGVNIYFATKKLFGNTSAKIACFLTILFPSLIYWQTLNIKEATVSFLMTLIIKRLVYLKDDKPQVLYFLLTIFYTGMLTITRSYFGILMFGITCIYFLIISKFRIYLKVIILLFLFGIMGLVTIKTGMGFMGMKFFQYYDLSLIDIVRKHDYTGGSQVLQNMSMGNVKDLIMFLPVGILYFLFSPFPWQAAGSIVQFMGASENILWYIIFVTCIQGLIISFKKYKQVSLMLFLILFSLILFYSIAMANMGLAFRFKDQLFPVFTIFSSVGIAEFNKRWIAKFKTGERNNKCQDT